MDRLAHAIGQAGSASRPQKRQVLVHQILMPPHGDRADARRGPAMEQRVVELTTRFLQGESHLYKHEG